jgi:hypothetical protein
MLPKKRLALIMLLGLAVRIAFMAVFEGEVNDRTERTLDALRRLHGPEVIFGTKPWPELNDVFPALAMAVGGDMFWSVRVRLHLGSPGQ